MVVGHIVKGAFVECTDSKQIVVVAFVVVVVVVAGAVVCCLLFVVVSCCCYCCCRCFALCIFFPGSLEG